MHSNADFGQTKAFSVGEIPDFVILMIHPWALGFSDCMDMFLAQVCVKSI